MNPNDHKSGCMWCCDRCNCDQHLCCGCGDNVPHGQYVCPECSEAANVEDERDA